MSKLIVSVGVVEPPRRNRDPDRRGRTVTVTGEGEGEAGGMAVSDIIAYRGTQHGEMCISIEMRDLLTKSKR